MNEDDQVQGELLADYGAITVTGNQGWTEIPPNNFNFVGYNTAAGTAGEVDNTVQKEELYLREKSIEYTIQAFGMKDVGIDEFTALMDYFYNYLKTGTTIKV